ncbi:MAG: hypothetical protein D8B56_06640 [Alloprevotella sp.]|nr:MAG: hypothetical protein D8B56_06640 [Alloprevotella sp.]
MRPERMLTEGQPDGEVCTISQRMTTIYEAIGLAFSQLSSMLCPPRENPRLCKGVAFSDIASQNQMKSIPTIRRRKRSEPIYPVSRSREQLRLVSIFDHKNGG